VVEDAVHFFDPFQRDADARALSLPGWLGDEKVKASLISSFFF
jgi:hypothetical protein